MKKLCSLLLVLLFLLPLGAAASAETAEAAPVEISDALGMLAIADAPEGAYVLTADIDMDGLDWTPIPFRGTLDGAGHTLYNLRIERVGEDLRETRDGNLKPYDTTFAGLFSVMENATIRDLNIRGAYMEIEGETHCFAGLLAGGMFNSSVQGVSVQGRARLNNYAVQSGIAGLVGYGCGDFGYCSVDVELIFEDRNFDSRCEEFMGGVLSCGIVNIENCKVHIEGYDSCHGYVHNGGLVGMYYYCGMNFRGLTVCGNEISGQISFFEDNPNRRAYCKATIGEELSIPGNYYGNDGESFSRNETWDYSSVLLPETCEAPSIEDTVTEPGCSEWGYTVHSCAGCGHSWTDSYTPPAHTPGDWETVTEASEAQPGVREQRCSVCGELLDSEEIAYVPPVVEEPEPLYGVDSSEVLGVTYRGSVRAMRSSAAREPLTWTSDNPAVAIVDQDGVVRGVSRGSTTVRYVSSDGLCSGVCEVKVIYSVWQWFLILFCFGWLWYI